MTAWDEVLEWIAEGYDDHSAEIKVQSDGRDYADDGETVIGLGITYAVSLIETGVYGDETEAEPPYTYWTHVGYGDSLDAAAARALAMKTEHGAVLEASR